MKLKALASIAARMQTQFVFGLIAGAGLLLLISLAVSVDLADKIKALAPALTALIVAYFGYQQWAASQQKIKHDVRKDLYDRRFAVWDATLRYGQAVMTLQREGPRGEQFEERSQRFISVLNESHFLFDAEVCDVLTEFHQVAGRYANVHQLPSIPNEPPDGVIQRVHQHNIDFFAMERLLTDLRKAMQPYLKFTRIT